MNDLEHIREILSRPYLPLPPREQKLGASSVEWWEANPGEAVIMAKGGSMEDRTLAEQYVKAQLEGHGYRRAQFTFDLPRYMRRHASWVDIMAKAKRLMQSGNVKMLRNGVHNIAAHVVGDHGEYDCEIGRDDPASRAITTWTCECPWDQYAWQRTRQWKKYEGRCCAHVLAAFWTSAMIPLDDHDPNVHGPLPPGQKAAPGGGGGSGKVPSGDAGGPPSPPSPPNVPAPPDGQMGPPSPSGPVDAPLAPPTAPGVLPPSPMQQLQMQQPPMPGMTPAGLPAPPNSVSVPGARMPSPFNPIQYPGGTYSGLFDRFRNPVKQYQKAIQDWDWGTWNPDVCRTDGCENPTAYHWRHPGDWYDRYLCEGCHARNLEHRESPFARPEEQEYTISPYESDGKGERPIEVTYGSPSLLSKAQPQPKTSAEFNPPEIVRLTEPIYGIAEGKSEAAGAGQYREVPAGSTGEVLSQDETTGWVEVIFPLDESSYNEPFHVRCFVEPKQLQHSRQRPPGPFIKRHY